MLQMRTGANDYELDLQCELAFMANLFFTAWERKLFYLTLVVRFGCSLCRCTFMETCAFMQWLCQGLYKKSLVTVSRVRGGASADLNMQRLTEHTLHFLSQSLARLPCLTCPKQRYVRLFVWLEEVPFVSHCDNLLVLTLTLSRDARCFNCQPYS